MWTERQIGAPENVSASSLQVLGGVSATSSKGGESQFPALWSPLSAEMHHGFESLHGLIACPLHHPQLPTEILPGVSNASDNDPLQRRLL